MIEPRRLREDAESTAELMLLEAGVSYRTSPDTRAKTLAALGLAGSAAVTVGAVSIAASSMKVGWTKLLLISGLGAGVVAPAGYVAWNQLQSHAPVVVSAPTVASPVKPRSVVAAPTAIVNQAPVLPEQPAIGAKTESKSPALAAELAALDRARARLSSGDASGALGKLDEYARTYPRGRLVLEAEVLRIDALAKSGRRDAARKRAESFLTRHPNSVLASRVRGYLD